MSSLQDGSLQDRQRAYLELQRRLGKAAPPRPNIVPFPPAFPPVVITPLVSVIDKEAERKAKLIEELQAEVVSLSTRMKAMVLEDQSPLARPSRIKPVVIAVARYYGVTVQDIVCSKRHRKLVHPRQVAMYLARELTGQTYPAIGRVMDRDHATIMSGVRRIAKLRETDPKLAGEIKELTDCLTPPGESHAV